MDVYLKASLDRSEGKQMSAELVAEGLVSQLEGESVDVEDSVFDVTTVEVLDGPKSKAPALKDDVLFILDETLSMYRDAFPLNIKFGDEDDDVDANSKYDNLTLNQMAFVKSFERLLFSDALGEAIRQAKARRWKQDQKRS